MKKNLIIILAILSFGASAQTSLDSLRDGYYASLQLAIMSIPQFAKSDTIYIRKDSHLGEYSGLLGDLRIVMIDAKTIHEKTKKYKTLAIKVIHPIEFKSGSLFITISDFGVKRKRNKYSFINSGYTTVKMEYNCSEAKFLYEILSSH